ncbi:Do family serine endopeptidase [Martelella mediterranea]|uniref:Do family serine endopeptidase n=1 Tax=Martelella mediterranea TaxID=293089 RepID=UPI001E332A8A|nr:Do family serine endopeptidase [Martelella mediterranea]MCD1635885.1 Do family serine endopeptidase [Martelella mediterranea]
MNEANNSTRLKTILKGSAAAGLVAAVVYGGITGSAINAFADPVQIEAPAENPGFADVVSAVSPAVVSVRVRGEVKQVSDNVPGYGFGNGLGRLPENHPLRRFFDQFGGPGFAAPSQGKGEAPREVRPMSQGSGFFISDDGYVVTNNHVVDNGSEFSILLDDGTELDASLVGKDSRTDLAVLKVDDKRNFTYVDFAEDEDVRVGDWVVAVGNPFGLGGSVTAGIVSALGRDIGTGPYDDYIQIDAAVNRGNSGGPAFNLNGEVVGINTAIFSPSGGNVGIAFAIPAYVAQDVVQDLIDDGKVERGWLGVQIQPVDAEIAESLGLREDRGALVVEPMQGSPAARAGIETGDVIIALNDEPIEDASDLSVKIASAGPSSEVQLSVWRDGETKSIDLTLGNLAKADVNTAESQDTIAPSTFQALPSVGLTVAPSQEGNGLVIAKVDPESDAASQGIFEGERIASINNRKVSDIDDAKAILNNVQKSSREHALFQIEGERGSRFVALPIQQS